MKRGGRTSLLAVLPLLFSLVACTEPVVNVDEPAKVDSCGLLLPIGIELVNDYFYTLEETDLGSTAGDPAMLPTEIIALNARGAELDSRIGELDCDVVLINEAIAEATAGLESDNPVTRVFLESVRGGVVAPILPTHGEWIFESGTVAAGTIDAIEEHPITLTIEHDAASGFAGCNGYFYPVKLADGIWSWADGAATITELLCVDDAGEERTDVMNIEDTYIRAFELVAGYSLDGETLVLSGDGVELRYSRSTGD